MKLSMFISFEATWHLWDKQVFPVSISQKKKKKILQNLMIVNNDNSGQLVKDTGGQPVNSSIQQHLGWLKDWGLECSEGSFSQLSPLNQWEISCICKLAPCHVT